MDRGNGAIALVLAGLLGAAGTIGAAIAAHGGDARLAGTAAAMALVHAPALLALGLAPSGRVLAPLVPVILLALGVVLFAGDLTARAGLGAGLFPSAAPIGGSLIIIGWLSLAVLAVAAAVRRP